MQVTIIGAGAMGRGIATRALFGRHTVRIIDRDPDKAAKLATDLRINVPSADVQPAGRAGLDTADIAVLALPFAAAEQVAAEFAAAFEGATVVDISNPVDFSTFDALVVPPGTSAAERIAGLIPAAHVVKAFNTTFAANLVSGQGGGLPLDVFVAGDDPAAKGRVVDLAQSAGLRAIDVGPLKRARELEGFQFLHMTLQQTLGTNWTSAIKIVG
jgi:predicted dinucleotide-binding enzyme